MKAILCHQYGSPLELQLREIPRPTPTTNQVLVRVHVTAVNDYDWSIVRGKPIIYRLIFGLRKPKHSVPGMEVAGVVEQVGSGAKTFKVGDEVYGDTSDHGFGTFAEYIVIDEAALRAKPPGMSFEDAAAIPHASLLAYQGLVGLGEIRDGMQILLNGAGGGVGTFALQLAKLYETEVTGVDTGSKLQAMSEMGFDHVIDYKQEDFTRNGRKYDLILDAKSTRGPFACARSLKQNGIYVTVGGQIRKLFLILVLKGVARMLTGKRLRILLLKANSELDFISSLYQEGKIKPVIDGPYSLGKAAQAIQRFGEGKHCGKVVISVS